MPPKLINYQDGMDHTIPTAPLQIVDALDMRAHDPGMCPLENCTGQVDYLVLVRWNDRTPGDPTTSSLPTPPQFLVYDTGLGIKRRTELAFKSSSGARESWK